MATDSFDACANELMSFVRTTKKLAHVPAVEDGPALERAALVLLYVLGERGPMRASALAEAVLVDLSTVSRQLTVLEAPGWITRQRDPDDRRASLVGVTEEGRRVLGCNLDARRNLLRELLVDWSEQERREFARLLGRLNENLERRHTAPSTAGADRRTS